MFVFANLLSAIAQIIDIALTIYMWLIIVRALISWVNPDPYNPVVRFLYTATEPVLYRVRRVIPNMGGLDVSPILVIFAIMFAKMFLVETLMNIAFKLKMGGGL